MSPDSLHFLDSVCYLYRLAAKPKIILAACLQIPAASLHSHPGSVDDGIYNPAPVLRV